MKDIYKNPTLYYIVVPIILALWPLLVWAAYLPEAGHRLNNEKAQYEKAKTTIVEILTLDPDRIKFSGSKTGDAEFDYFNAVETIANLREIPSTSYKLSSGRIIESKGQKSQNANVSLKKVSVTKFAEFLSTLQLRWAKLQCVRLKMTKKKGLPDSWDFDLEFKYYY